MLLYQYKLIINVYPNLFYFIIDSCCNLFCMHLLMAYIVTNYNVLVSFEIDKYLFFVILKILKINNCCLIDLFFLFNI